jgi:hypothetical protein
LLTSMTRPFCVDTQEMLAAADPIIGYDCLCLCSVRIASRSVDDRGSSPTTRLDDSVLGSILAPLSLGAAKQKSAVGLLKACSCCVRASTSRAKATAHGFIKALLREAYPELQRSTWKTSSVRLGRRRLRVPRKPRRDRIGEDRIVRLFILDLSRSVGASIAAGSCHSY